MLDSAFAKPSIFKRLFKKVNLTHIRYTYHLAPQTEDRYIYHLASQKKIILVTLDNDFKALIIPKGAGVFIIPSYLSNDEIDAVLTDFVAGKNPEGFQGKATKIPAS